MTASQCASLSCLSNTCAQTCTSNQECAPGFTCAATGGVNQFGACSNQGVCSGQCAANQLCTPLFPLPALSCDVACNLDADCPAGQGCVYNGTEGWATLEGLCKPGLLSCLPTEGVVGDFTSLMTPLHCPIQFMSVPSGMCGRVP
jgi:hypothetical protein